MTDVDAYSLGYKDGKDGIPPWPPAPDGRLYVFYMSGYSAGRIARE